MDSTAIQIADLLGRYRLPELWGYAMVSLDVSRGEAPAGMQWRSFPNRVKAAIITDSLEGKGLKVVLLPILSPKPSIVHDSPASFYITQAELTHYLSLTGDDNPIHRTGHPVIPGLLLLSFLEKRILKSPLSEFSVRFHEALFRDEHFAVEKTNEEEWHVKKSSDQLIVTLKLK